MPAEIFSPRQDSLAEWSEFQLAPYVSRVTVTVVMHLQSEWALVDAGHSGCRTMSQAVQQASDLPVTEDTLLVSLPVTRKDIERTCVTCPI